MSRSLEVTVAARVPTSLRGDLTAIARRRECDVSTVIRDLLRQGADRELAGAPAHDEDMRLFYAAAGGAPLHGTRTQRDAANAVQPRAGSQRARALGCIVRAQQGATVDEVEQELERTTGRRIHTNGLAKRVSELLHAGAITTTIDLRGTDGSTSRGVLTRETRGGVQAQVYVVTDLGLTWHRALTALDTAPQQEQGR